MEIINFLGQVNNPDGISSYMWKMFDGINYLVFNEKFEIHSVRSNESELLRLKAPIPVKNLNADSWILLFEKTLKESVLTNIHDVIIKESFLDASDRCRSYVAQAALVQS